VSRPRVKIKRLAQAKDLDLPAYMTPGAAGLDLRAAVDRDEGLVIETGQIELIPTGMALEIPPGFEGQVRPRSGLAIEHGLTLINAPGTVDSDYRGELACAMINLGPEPFTVRRGERIAQLIIAPVVQAALEEVDELAGSERGSGGFGHTGT